MHGLVRACTAMRALLGATYHREIKRQVLCSSWGGRCFPPARWVCPASPAPCAGRRRGKRALGAAPRARLPARFPVSPSALPDRLQSREFLPGAAPSLPATQRASPPPPALTSSVHSRAQRSCRDAPQGGGCHSWTESGSSAQLEEAQLRMRMEELPCEWRGPSVRSGEEGGKHGWEGSGRHRHTRTHTQRPTLLPREEIINLLGIKSAASQKPILPKCRRTASRPPLRALPASSPVAFVLRDRPDTRASVWAPRPHAGMKRSPGFAQTPRALAPPAGLGAP